MVNYAVKLTYSPKSVCIEDVRRMKTAGLTDAAIHDVASIVGYFNFVNRMALGLGIELEPEFQQARAREYRG